MTTARQYADRGAQAVPERSVAGTCTLDDQNPWPGPAAYDEASSRFFFGRSQEASELLRLIQLAALTVVYGKSGLGKTSLLQAGLYPVLRAEHYLPVHLRIDFSDGLKTPPLIQVMQRLTEELDGARAEYPPPRSDESLWEYLHRKDLELWSEDNFPFVPVLVFDQFEELFSRSGGNLELVKQVFNDLADLIENRIPTEIASEAARSVRSSLDLRSQRYRVVLSFREDFLPEVRTWEQKVPSLLRNCLRLEPMSHPRAIEAVEQAGKAVLDKDVAPCIVDFVGKLDPTSGATAAADIVIEPVLLSLFCSQLNRRRPPGTRIEQTLVEEAGQDILDSFYREVLDDPKVQGPPDVAHFIENHLIQGDHFRGDYPKEEALSQKLITQDQLTALTDRHRLLRIVHRPDTTRVELIHDRLVPVVRKARDGRRAKQHQEERERLARAAQAERDQERARSEELQRQRDTANRSFKLATLSGIITGGLALWAWSLFWDGSIARQKIDQMKQSMALSASTQRLAESRQAFKGGSEPLQQLMYQGLAAYRLADKSFPEVRIASRTALHLSLEASAYLRKIVTISNLMPTSALAYSPDGKTLAVGGEDGVIRLLDAKSFQETGRLECPTSPAESAWTLAYNSDGERLVAGYTSDSVDAGGLVCVFDVAQRSVLRRWSAKKLWGKASKIYSVAYGGKPGTEFVISGGSEKMLRKLDINSGSMSEIPHPKEVASVAISADGGKLASGGEDAIIRVWSLADFSNPRAQPVELKGHEDIIQQVVFSPADSSILVSTGDDARIMVWRIEGKDAKKGCLAQQSKPQPARIYNVAVSKDGLVAAASTDGKVQLFRLSEVKTPCSKPTGKEALSKADIPELTAIPDNELSGHGGTVMGVAFNPDGYRLASTGQDGSIRIWGPKTAGFSLAQLDLGSQRGNVTSLAISPDSKSIAAGDDNGNIHLWDPPEANEPVWQPTAASWKAHEKAIRSIAYIRIGTQLALVSGGDDGVLKRWDPATRKVIGPEMSDHAESVGSIAVSPDGKLLAAGSSDGTVRLWEAATGRLATRFEKPVGAPQGYKIYAVGFSAEGKYLAVGDSLGGLRALYLKVPGTERRLQANEDFILSLSRGGARWLLTAGWDGSVLEWEPSALSKPQAKGLKRHDEFKLRMRFSDPKALWAMDTSADSGLIVTGGSKGQVQLWDGEEHVLIGSRFLGHGENSEIRAVAMAPDASFFVTADDSKILAWPGPSRWADIICSKLVSNMSHAQWREWVAQERDYVMQCPDLPIPPDDTKPTVSAKKSPEQSKPSITSGK